MEALYLALIIFGITGQNITRKMYTEKMGESGAYPFSMLASLFSMLFFVAAVLFSPNGFLWNPKIIPYAVAFAVSYAFAGIFGVLAFATGPMSISSLMISYSLMIPTFYGIIFLNETPSVFFWIGLSLLAISLFLVNKKNDSMRVSLKWFVFVFLSFAGNGLCSTFQKMQQVAFNKAYKNEFMILSLGIVVLVLAVVSLVTSKGKLKKQLYHARFTAASCGIMNGGVNLLVMVLSGGMIAISVMFPLISAGGIVVTYLISKIFYKEKLTKIQLVGFLMGVASIVFLSI